MGGSAGRADALVGTIEAQKAEGVLHLHFFIFLQMAYQFHNLSEIATMFRHRLLSLDALKQFHSHLRCAKCPDLQKFKNEHAQIEKAWPAYATDFSLCRPPAYMWETLNGRPSPHLHETSDVGAWTQEGVQWLAKRDARLQHVLSRMNHHIHPLVDEATGQRRPFTFVPTEKQA